MTRSRSLRFGVVPFAVAAVVLFGAPLAFAQSGDDDSEEPEDIAFSDMIVVTGTRAQPRSVTESMVPIDVLPAEELAEQGETDLGNLLRTLVPSYNVNTQPISDAATVVRPANLRNLAPDHTLVLVNNKRRHRAAVIYWLGNGVADGAQGPDISAIPSIALKQVEVLRDGASAQYGSDAIAGVMNFLLKDDAEGGAIEFRTGGFSEESDGRTNTIAANFGLPLGDAGFANFSLEFGHSDPTSRSVQRDDAAALIRAGNTFVREPAQIWGSPDVEDDLKLWGNFGYTTPGNTHLYAHANLATKTVTGGFYFRNPNTRTGVFGYEDPNPTDPDDPRQFLLLGDLVDAQDGVLDNSGGCPLVTLDDGSQRPGVEIFNDVPDPVALASVIANPDCFSFQEIFPGGFTPSFGGDVTDASLTAGVRGTAGDKLAWDASVAFGSNEVDFFIMNTVNASLGPATPTAFDPGAYTQEDLNVNFDISYPIRDNLNLAAGVEFRDETFEITQGQLESYDIGSLAEQGFSAASNGFPGFGDIAAGEWSRSNYAVYGDLERSAESWTFGAALRFEDFEDFGTTLNGKLSFRRDLSDDVRFRTSVSTGFRAPTPGQSNAFNVSTEFDLVAMELVNNGTIPSSSAVAQLRGGEPLEPEESVNYTLGIVAEKGPVTITADLFRIDLSDRLGVTQLFTLTPAEVAQLISEGVTSAANLQNFRFFANDFDTETQGIDIVLTWEAGDRTDVSWLFNFTETEVSKFNPATLDATRIQELEQALPEMRSSVTVRHKATDRIRLLGRASFYDEWFDSEDGQVYDGRTIFDAEAEFKFHDQVAFVIGAQNLFDTTPPENPGAASGVGNRYSQFSPFGFNGQFWYARLKYQYGRNF